MNVMVYDFPEMEHDTFVESIAKETGETWTTLGRPHGTKKDLRFIFKLFLRRNRYDRIVFWQQRHGIYYANFCNLFHIKKAPKAYILTFIYKREPGIKGAIKSFLYRQAVKSKSITNIICYSQHEVDYYGNMLGIPKGKIVATTFGLEDQKYRNGEPVISNEGFILDVGISNRDHDFVEKAFKQSEYKAVIADRTYAGKGNDNCIVRHDVTYGECLYSLIEKCFAVIVPLKDENISAGQTVFIQAMMFSKPIIVTSSNTVNEYVVDGQNGFIIKKTKEDLINCLDTMSNDKKLYEKLCENSRRMFEQSYSFETLGKNVSQIMLGKRA